MNRPEPRSVSFAIDEPFAIALRILRRALEREGLRVPCELRTSERLRNELGVGLKESIVLYVDAPLLLLEATVFTVVGSLYIPEPLALAASGATECRVTLRSIKPLLDESLPATARDAVLSLHERIFAAVQTVGHRETMIDPCTRHAALA